jgi:hypothetical protein
MRGMELWELLCVGCLPAVEKVGRVWLMQEAEAAELTEVRVAKKNVGGIGDKNMGNSSTELARE